MNLFFSFSDGNEPLFCFRKIYGLTQKLFHNKNFCRNTTPNILSNNIKIFFSKGKGITLEAQISGPIHFYQE